MPFTPFHVVPVWPIFVRWPGRWDVLALSLGAVVSDLEAVTAYPLTGDSSLSRGLMHSLLGIVSVNLVLSLVAARFLIPKLARRLDNRFPGRGWRTFARRDFVGDRKPWAVTVASALVGGLSHLALDLTHHGDTPLLWPWRGEPLHLGPWASEPWSSLVANGITGILFLWMFFKWVGR